MKISVLIAVSGHEPLLPAALASLRAQTHSDWELLIVEHGVNGRSEPVARAFAATVGAPVHHLVLGESHGIASARNRLLDLATSDYVAFLDPTGRWLPAHLADAAVHLAGQTDVVVSDVRSLDESTRPALRHLPARPQLVLNAVRTLFVSDALAVPSAVIFRRDFFHRAGPFDTRFRANETRDFWLRCALVGARFGATHRATCEFVPPRPNVVRTILLAEQAVQFYEKHRDLPSVPAALRRHLLAASLVRLGQLLRQVDAPRAARCFWRAWSLQPVHVQTLGQFALVGWRSPPGAKSPGSGDKEPTESLTRSRSV
jgi:glycosyltransferase involved in cell wall biosynthesis